MAVRLDTIGETTLAAAATAVNQVSNRLERAKILISDRRIDLDKLGVMIPKGAVSAGIASMPKVTLPGGDMVNNLAKKGANAALSAAKQAAQDALDNITPDALKNLGYNKEFSVQFNPSSLNISGFSGGSYEIMDYGGTNKAAKTTPIDTTLQLSVNLIFDQMDLANSFPMDSIDFSISNAMMTALKGVTDTHQMNISVQAATEGFIGALSNPYTRLVCFKWGELEYKGVIKNVQANYKMFDIIGRPVRSEVALSIYLADKEITSGGGQTNLGFWDKAYRNAFSDATKYGASFADKVKKASNLILGN